MKMKPLHFIVLFILSLCFGLNAAPSDLSRLYDNSGSHSDSSTLAVQEEAPYYVMALNLNIRADINELINTILEETKALLKIVFAQDGVTEYNPEEGGRFISILAKDQVLSLYFHPTEDHTATAHGKTTAGPSCAQPGFWAVAIAMRSYFGGNRAFYSVGAPHGFKCSNSTSGEVAIPDKHLTESGTKDKNFNYVFSLNLLFTIMIGWMLHIY